MNSKLLSKAAAEAFNSRNYELALKHYKELAKLLGENNFYANIRLCEHRLGISGGGASIERADEGQSWYTELDSSQRGARLRQHLHRSALLKASGEQSSRYHESFKLRVGIITDEFMYNYYAGAFERLIPLTPTNYQSVLSSGIDLLLFVSCWFGLNNEWRGVTFDAGLHKAMDEIVHLCKKSAVPTVFQTIEDPSNYHKFLEIAKKFDYIFTTDVDVIENYKNDCKHNRVHFGEYGFNPAFNNPIGNSRSRINAAFFAGSYPRRYADRCQDMEMIFDGIVRAGANLVIADRNYGTSDKNLRFPEKYEAQIIDKFDHRVLQDVHKLFRFNINLNSIKHSPTMCAMRVYELQAQGELLLSNYAKSVELSFPSVKIVRSGEDLSNLFRKTFSGYMAEKYLRAQAVRQMYTDKTVFDQAGRMLSIVGVPEGRARKALPKVHVLYGKPSKEIEQSFQRQTYENKTLVDVKSFVNGQIDCAPEDYFTIFSGDFCYTKDYLVDQINCFKFTSAAYITKLSLVLAKRYLPDIENEFTNRIHNLDLTVFSFSMKDILRQKLSSGDMAPFLLESGFASNPFEVNEFDARISEGD